MDGNFKSVKLLYEEVQNMLKVRQAIYKTDFFKVNIKKPLTYSGFFNVDQIITNLKT